LDDPARHEAGQRNFVSAKEIEDPRQANQGVVAHVCQRMLLVEGAFAVGRVNDAVGVHIETEADGAARSIGPGRRILDHRGSSLQLFTTMSRGKDVRISGAPSAGTGKVTRSSTPD